MKDDINRAREVIREWWGTKGQTISYSELASQLGINRRGKRIGNLLIDVGLPLNGLVVSKHTGVPSTGWEGWREAQGQGFETPEERRAFHQRWLNKHFERG